MTIAGVAGVEDEHKASVVRASLYKVLHKYTTRTASIAASDGGRKLEVEPVAVFDECPTEKKAGDFTVQHTPAT